MAEIQIERVVRGEPYQTKYGSELVPYDLTWTSPEGQQLTGRISQKPETAEPQEGQTLDVTIELKGDRRLLKRVPKDAPRSSNGASGGRSPQDTKQIVRQHSEHMAILFMASLQKESIGLPGDTAAEKLEALRKIVDWFDDDVYRTAKSV